MCLLQVDIKRDNSLIKPNSQQDMVLEDYDFKSNSGNTFSLFRVLNRVFVLDRKP